MTKVTASEIPNLGKGVAKLRPLEEKKVHVRCLFGRRQGWRKEGSRWMAGFPNYGKTKRREGGLFYVSKWLVSTLV